MVASKKYMAVLTAKHEISDPVEYGVCVEAFVEWYTDNRWEETGVSAKCTSSGLKIMARPFLKAVPIELAMALFYKDIKEFFA